MVGVKVQVLTTASGIPVEFAFLPGRASDTRGLDVLPLELVAGSESLWTTATLTMRLKMRRVNRTVWCLVFAGRRILSGDRSRRLITIR